MDPQTSTPRCFKLAGWSVEADLNRVTRGGETHSLEPKAIEVLCRLAASPGEVVRRETLLQAVWQGRAVVDQVLTRAVGQLRSVLGDDPHDPRIIETVARRGYRLLTPVEAPEAPPLPVPSPVPASPRRPRGWLRWPVLAGAGGLLALLAGWLFQRAVTPPAPPLRAVAVLPFKVLAGEDVPAYYGEGLAENLITALSQVPGLKVVTQSSAFDRQLAALSLPEIGGRLDVDTVVQGSVQGEAGAVRITARLVRLRDGEVLWAGDARGLVAGEWFALQDRMVRHVLAAMDQPAPRKRPAPPTANTAAHRQYLRGRHLWNQRTPEGMRQSLPALRLALDADPSYAQAHAALAQAYVLLPFYGLGPPDDAMPRARAAAREALALDPDLADAHAVLAVVHYQFEHDWDAAASSFRRALAANPNHATARQWYSEFLGYSGRFDEAQAQIDKASALDPLSPVVATLRGSPDFWARRYDAARRRYFALLQNEPGFPLASYALAVSYHAQGRLDEAVEIYRRVLPQLGESFVLASLAHAEAMRGDKAAARRHAEALGRLAERGYVPPYKFAVIHAGMGEADAAFAMLERSYAARDDRLVLLDVDPLLDPLRGDPRLADLRRRVRLPGSGAPG
jgi:DNA-binding winged helix-turn-helix (wHTH) protein/TolB-like protein/Tfp pilus assembly protein PilF